MIDRLEELLDHSTRLPLTSRVVLDEDEYLRLIDQMRISLPQEIARARQVEAEREAILAAAHEQAKAMVEEARQRAEQMVAEHAIVAEAQARSAEILRRAHEDAQAIRGEADVYALEVLERIEAQLAQFARQVRNGIDLLQAAHPTAAAVDNAVEPHIVGGEDAPGLS